MKTLDLGERNTEEINVNDDGEYRCPSCERPGWLELEEVHCATPEEVEFTLDCKGCRTQIELYFTNPVSIEVENG